MGSITVDSDRVALQDSKLIHYNAYSLLTMMGQQLHLLTQGVSPTQSKSDNQITQSPRIVTKNCDQELSALLSETFSSLVQSD